MSSKRRKAAARGVIILYAFITATFSLAHNDYVPLDAQLTFCPTDFNSNSVASDANELVCPAHNFAQSTTGTAALSQNFSSSEDATILKVEHHDHIFAPPARNLSVRAPPQA